MEVGGWRGRMKILLEINFKKSRKSNSCQHKKFKELLSNYIENYALLKYFVDMYHLSSQN